MSRKAHNNDVETIEMDQMEILSITMNQYPPEQKGIVVIFAVGYTENAQFMAVKRKQMVIGQAAYDAFCKTKNLSGKAIMGFVEAWVYKQITSQKPAK